MGHFGYSRRARLAAGFEIYFIDVMGVPRP